MTYTPVAPTTSDLALREALSLSVNRQAMIDTMFGGGHLLAVGGGVGHLLPGSRSVPRALRIEPTGTDHDHHDAGNGRTGRLSKLRT